MKKIQSWCQVAINLLRLSSESWKNSVTKNECSRAKERKVLERREHVQLEKSSLLRQVRKTIHLQPVEEVKTKDRRDSNMEWQEGALHSSKIDAETRPDNQESNKWKGAETGEYKWDHYRRSCFWFAESVAYFGGLVVLEIYWVNIKVCLGLPSRDIYRWSRLALALGFHLSECFRKNAGSKKDGRERHRRWA